MFTGFSSTQAEAVVWALIQISQTTLDHMNKNMVTKPQQVNGKDCLLIYCLPSVIHHSEYRLALFVLCVCVCVCEFVHM